MVTKSVDVSVSLGRVMGVGGWEGGRVGVCGGGGGVTHWSQGRPFAQDRYRRVGMVTMIRVLYDNRVVGVPARGRANPEQLFVRPVRAAVDATLTLSPSPLTHPPHHSHPRPPPPLPTHTHTHIYGHPGRSQRIPHRRFGHSDVGRSWLCPPPSPSRTHSHTQTRVDPTDTPHFPDIDGSGEGRVVGGEGAGEWGTVRSIAHRVLPLLQRAHGRRLPDRLRVRG